MKTLASCVLISAAIACVVMAHGRPLRQSPVREERNSSLRSEWIVRDPIASPPALEKRFGRDTLLYFPIEATQPHLPVALTATGAFTR
jgi:hypothetical protein